MSSEIIQAKKVFFIQSTDLEKYFNRKRSSYYFVAVNITVKPSYKKGTVNQTHSQCCRSGSASFWEARSGSASKWKAGSGSASK
jgi:hypothetical protein